jgi:hypothetical protein
MEREKRSSENNSQSRRIIKHVVEHDKYSYVLHRRHAGAGERAVSGLAGSMTTSVCAQMSSYSRKESSCRQRR